MTVDDLVKGTRILLGVVDSVAGTCTAFDCDAGSATLGCVLQGVGAALSGEGVHGTERVDLGGRALSIECVGAGAPTVVFEAGGGHSSGVWSLVQPTVGGFTRACAYDRAGLGSSDMGPQPRDALHVVADLHALLRSACLSGPLVLVGHSYGGQYIHLYASMYPQEVAGLVFVDQRSE